MTPATPEASTHEDGFTLIEVLVAFVIVSLGLAMLYTALSDNSRQVAETTLRQGAVSHAQSHLDQLGLSIAMEPSQTAGRYPNGTGWRLTVSPLADGPRPSQRLSDPLLVVLEAFDRSGRRIAYLKTIRLTPGTPTPGTPR